MKVLFFLRTLKWGLLLPITTGLIGSTGAELGHRLFQRQVHFSNAIRSLVVGFSFIDVRIFLILSLLAVCLNPSLARAAEVEVLKQKKCSLLLSSGPGLVKGQLVKAETSSGKTVSFKLSKFSGKKALVKMTASKSGRCASVSGQTLIYGSKSSKTANRFGIGLFGSGGQFTFRQPFVPAGANAELDGEIPKELVVNGLSGMGFSAGTTLRILIKKPLNLELGVGALSSTTTGQTRLPNGDDYKVEGKFLEVTLTPGASFTSCISSRLYCRVGGVFAFPIKSTITVSDSAETQTAQLKYLRLGGDLAAGVNIGSSFTILGGTQISQTKGSFKFDNLDQVNLAVLSVYIFGGFVAVF